MNNNTFEDVLERDGYLVYSNVGTSMMPMIREGRDLMIIKKRPAGKLKKYDAVLYRHNGNYILHRILKVRDNDYVICGDHLIHREYGITDDDIIGVLEAVVRDEKKIPVTSKKYRFYVHLWCDFFHIRVAILYIKRKFRGLCRRIKRIIKK